jgi:phosphoribosylanthranilate isomerase
MAVRIKVCGITRREDAELAVSLGVDYVGINFYPPSPRYVTVEAAGKIAQAVKGRARVVGVFVNAERSYINDRLNFADLDLLQFHGDEEDDALKGWPVPVIRALRIRPGAPLEPSNLARIPADFLLLDTFHPRLFGGTGQTRSLDAIRELDLGRVFISGGLTPHNAADAALLAPYGLDVASGVEAAPGVKDAGKLRSFVANARSSSIASGIASDNAKLSR